MPLNLKIRKTNNFFLILYGEISVLIGPIPRLFVTGPFPAELVMKINIPSRPKLPPPPFRQDQMVVPLMYRRIFFTLHLVLPCFRGFANFGNFGGFHRTLQRMRLANRGRLIIRTPGPVPFGTCICSNVETILSWTRHVYGPFEFWTPLGTSILLRHTFSSTHPSPKLHVSYRSWSLTSRARRKWLGNTCNACVFDK